MKIQDIFQKQVMMRRVLISLLPVFLFAIYLYGLRLIILTVIVFTIGFLIEFFFERKKNKKVSEAVLITCGLYVLSLPPNVPLWIAGIGIIVAVFLGKEVFGGFGRNPFNPAIAGRLFVYITFPNQMTTGWLNPGNFGIDSVASVTPLNLIRSGQQVDIINLLFGFRSGAIGESVIFLILLAGIYLIATKTASWRIILSTLLGAGILSTLFYLLNIENSVFPVYPVFSGSLIFVTVFMATDPVSAPKKPISQFIYGFLIGTITILIRTFSLFIEGTSFAILVSNTFASLLDQIIPKPVKKKSKGIKK